MIKVWGLIRKRLFVEKELGMPRCSHQVVKSGAGPLRPEGYLAARLEFLRQRQVTIALFLAVLMGPEFARPYLVTAFQRVFKDAEIGSMP